MSMGNTGGTRPPQRKASRWKGVLFGWSVLFGLGFVGGLQATKKVAKEGHPLLQKVMGLENFIPASQPLTPLGTPHPAPNTTAAPAAPITTPQPNAPAKTQPTPPPAQTSARPEPDEPLPANPDELDKMVAKYNILLRDLESAAASYQEAKRITSNPNAPQAEQDKAIHQQSEAAEKIVSTAHEGNTLYDYIHAQSQFSTRYRETTPAIAGAQLLKGLPELSVENLRFIRPKH